MTIPELGPLAPDTHIPEWLVSAPIPIPFFDGTPLAFTLDGFELGDESAIGAAVGSFLSLTSDDRIAASNHVFKQFQRYTTFLSRDELGCWPEHPTNVWQHVHPTALTLCRRGRRDTHIYVRIEAECDWDPEHGLQIIYRCGHTLSRVSEQDGHLTHTDAFDLPEHQDVIVDSGS
jgi:hypothetical protein